MIKSFWDHPIATIEKALGIRKEIEALQKALSHIVDEIKAPAASAIVAASTKRVDGRKGKRSVAARAKMAAAQKARWAKKKGASTPPAAFAVKPGKKKRVLSAASRANMAAAQRARRTKEKIAPELSMPNKLVW